MSMKSSTIKIAIGALLSVLAACSQGPATDQGGEQAVAAKQDQALGSPFAQCGADARACVEAAGPDGDAAPCREQFQACTQAAIDEAKAQAAEVKACLEDAHGCAEAATTQEDSAACRQSFFDCVGYTPPPPPPGVECVKGLRSCIEAGTEPRTCADQARACFEALNPTDAGQ